MTRRPDWIKARKAIPKSVKQQAWSDCEGLCQGCGVRLVGGDYEFDHITPVALGGTNDPENIQVLCTTHSMCHQKKTADDVVRIAKADRQGVRSGQQAKRKKRGTGQLQGAGFRGHRKFNGELVWRDR